MKQKTKKKTRCFWSVVWQSQKSLVQTVVIFVYSKSKQEPKAQVFTSQSFHFPSLKLNSANELLTEKGGTPSFPEPCIVTWVLSSSLAPGTGICVPPAISISRIFVPIIFRIFSYIVNIHAIRYHKLLVKIVQKLSKSPDMTCLT